MIAQSVSQRKSPVGEPPNPDRPNPEPRRKRKRSSDAEKPDPRPRPDQPHDPQDVPSQELRAAV